MNEEHYENWIENNQSNLEAEFISKEPPEDQPLDDEYPDYVDDHGDRFGVFCKEQYDKFCEVEETDKWYK